MNVINTLKAIKNELKVVRPKFTTMVSENFLVITHETNDVYVRLASMGYVGKRGVKLPTPGISFAHKELEQEFSKFLSENLSLKNDSNKTILVPVEKFNIEKKWIEIDSVDNIQPEVDRLVSILDKVTLEIIPHFQDKKAFGNHIAQYDFDNRTKVQMGGKPPTIHAKQVFLLYTSGNIDRAEEYISGMQERLSSRIENNNKKKTQYLEWQASLEEFYIKLRNHFNQT